VPLSGVATSTTLTVTAPATTASLRGNSKRSLPGSVLALTLCFVGWRRRRGLQLPTLALVATGVGLCTGCAANVIFSPIVATVHIVATNGSLQPSATLTLKVQ
jgi:hypothetical protein